MNPTNEKSTGYLSFVNSIIAPMLTNPTENAKQYSQQYLEAVNGCSDAQFRLAYRYFYGEGVEQSYKDAIFWYQKSAIQGDAAAQYNLGLLYLNGHGTVKDNRQAAAWFYQSMLQGYLPAQHQFGLMCFAIKEPIF